jgi:Kef-type K+ transport system membrane component KefB
MAGPDTSLLLIGAATVVAFFVGKLANRVRLPAVVGYIVTGVALGPSMVTICRQEAILCEEVVDSLGVVSDIALALVAFTIGSELRAEVFRKVGRGILLIIVLESLLAFAFVTAGVYLVERDWALALILGAVAPASAPAGTLVVLQEFRAKGPLTSSLLAVVGLDDGLGIVIYAFAAAVAHLFFTGLQESGVALQLGKAFAEIAGAVALGLGLGFLLVLLARRLRSRNDVLIVSAAVVFVCAGLSNWLHVSLILSNLVLGMVAINLSWKTGQRAFDALQSITPPIYVLFFVLAGAHLDIALLPAMGLVGLAYIVCRVIGKLLGAYIGSSVTAVPDVVRKYLWLGIISQAGVAIGLGLLVMREFSRYGEQGRRVASLVITTVAATTLIFEILAPITTKIAIRKADEIDKAAVRE